MKFRARPLQRPPSRMGWSFVTDDAGNDHCVDAETGEDQWVYSVGRSTWGSTLGAIDGNSPYAVRR